MTHWEIRHSEAREAEKAVAAREKAKATWRYLASGLDNHKSRSSSSKVGTPASDSKVESSKSSRPASDNHKKSAEKKAKGSSSELTKQAADSQSVDAEGKNGSGPLGDRDKSAGGDAGDDGGVALG